ncbi:MAG: choice-of-anchor J domain-containing protein [candidate division WOR-3 bacterium]|nr:choice-of-anchor J domain-containing protein [candidate division WOR-3 bacterium]
MKNIVRLLIAGLLLLLSPKLMWGEDYRNQEVAPTYYQGFFSHKVKEPYSDIPVITRMTDFPLSYKVKEPPQLVEFRSVDGKGDVVLKDIGKSTVIFGPESFESTTFPPTGWSQYSLWPYSSYHWYRKENNGHDGSYVAWIDCDPNAYYNGQDELLQTPQLDFSQCEGCTLFFFLRQGSYTADVLYIGVSTDGGAPSGTWTVPAALSQTGSSWGGYYLSLSPDYDGDSSVVIGFEYAVYQYTSGGDVGLDYILVTAGSGGASQILNLIHHPAGVGLWSAQSILTLFQRILSSPVNHII